jgi:hypothetical protein
MMMLTPLFIIYFYFIFMSLFFLYTKWLHLLLYNSDLSLSWCVATNIAIGKKSSNGIVSFSYLVAGLYVNLSCASLVALYQVLWCDADVDDDAGRGYFLYFDSATPVMSLKAGDFRWYFQVLYDQYHDGRRTWWFVKMHIYLYIQILFYRWDNRNHFNNCHILISYDLFYFGVLDT